MSEATATKPAKPAKGPKTKSAPKTFTYNPVVITCACGAEYASGSTLDTLRVDICANCHPFFTGETRILDTEGRVEKFKKRYAKK
ncbi:50S ribosomal protein L31 [bacterium]|nr:50S ribosomal protein L31 [bacterium]